MKLIGSVFLFIMSWSFIAMAQAVAPVVAPAPAIVPAVIPQAAGVMGWISAHGGFQAAVLLLVGSAFAILSAVRQVLYNFDGIAPGESIPADKSALSTLNKVCIVLGKIVDFVQGNTQH